MKTRKQIFESFPEPYRSQAFENMKDYRPMLHNERLDFEYPNEKDALSLAFLFYDTPQGFNYWWNFYESLDNV